MYILLDYAFDIGFNTLRPKEDTVSFDLSASLEELTTSDATTQYILIGVCAGLVLVTAAAIAPIFVMVIRNKCKVFCIFAYIGREEVVHIVEQCKRLDLRGMRCRRSWVLGCKERADVFWRRLGGVDVGHIELREEDPSAIAVPKEKALEAAHGRGEEKCSEDKKPEKPEKKEEKVAAEEEKSEEKQEEEEDEEITKMEEKKDPSETEKQRRLTEIEYIAQL